jgi:hypothetical protein
MLTGSIGTLENGAALKALNFVFLEQICDTVGQLLDDILLAQHH